MSRLITYYGDDFTGSTDVMEALATHGVTTALFTRIPTESEFAPFAEFEAVGLAGTSRSETPAWMDEHLPQAYMWLKSLDARYCHYKTCSTFDSSPAVGSTGRAAEIGARVFDQAIVPLVVGVPQLKRYTFAGHLFAAYQGEVFRIDRHPVMARHPVTPMDEADLRLHLARQTTLPIVLANTAWPKSGIGMIDVHDSGTQAEAGKRLLAHAGRFVVGSSGLEYALMQAMEKVPTAEFKPLNGVAQIIVVSGSVSPTTERQIRAALNNGFETVAVPALELAAGRDVTVLQAAESALRVLSQGRSPLVHTALGAASDQSARLDSIANGRRNIGVGLGRILRAVLERSKLKRAIIAGGDSSSHALGQLDIFALTTLFPLTATPGSPLCKAHAGSIPFDGLEIAMKGGQLGGDDYFVQLRDGISYRGAADAARRQT